MGVGDHVAEFVERVVQVVHPAALAGVNADERARGRKGEERPCHEQGRHLGLANGTNLPTDSDLFPLESGRRLCCLMICDHSSIFSLRDILHR